MRALILAVAMLPGLVFGAKTYTCQDSDGVLYEQYMPCPEGLEPDQPQQREPVERSRDQAREESPAAKCRRDHVCWGKEHRARASYDCKQAIADLARYDHEWTDGWIAPALERVRWADQGRGIVRYEGDELKLQNGFGAWQPHEYWCEWDTINDRVVDVGAAPAS